MRPLPKVNRRVRSLRLHGAAWLVAASLVLAAGCENGVSITGQVIVPVDVQQLFSPEQPGVVVLRATKVGGGGSLRYLCAPQSQELTVPYSINKFGCVAEQLVEARAFRVKPNELGDVHCDDPVVVSRASTGLLGEELAYGAATIFRGEGGPCDSGSTTADVTMAVGAAHL